MHEQYELYMARQGCCGAGREAGGLRGVQVLGEIHLQQTHDNRHSRKQITSTATHGLKGLGGEVGGGGFPGDQETYIQQRQSQPSAKHLRGTPRLDRGHGLGAKRGRGSGLE